MKYTAQFYDINEKLYTLEIGSGEVQNITLSATPFITELETSDSHLYKPCKYSSATIGMITDDYKFDLYSSTAQQNKVVLSSASGIVWVGYVTPNLYSQGYENELEEIEVEAIDALSTLQYYKYTTIGGKKNIVSFTQIINHLLSKCNAYSSFNGNRSILSDRLEELMQDRLDKKEQMMLFLNRRGYAGFVSCRACGYVVKCPHCDVSLSVHRGGKMVCHYCGYETQTVRNCPSCGSTYIGGFRAGTQQIEEIVKRKFPQARVLRMDMDTTKNKGGHEKILSKFADEEADIMIGTQMIVKGHDFPNVTLVGVLAADMSLYSDDYRSGERTFQLLTQAAGRAGRGRSPGEVVIQTYSPEHYSIQMAARQDYEGFYEKEMNYRDLMGYPPASQLMAVLMTGADEVRLATAAEYLKKYAVRVNTGEEIQVIGPASPSVGKVNDVYRKVLYLKSREYKELVWIKNHMERYIEINRGFADMRIQFDFNPMNIF